MSNPHQITQAGEYQIDTAEIISYRIHGEENEPYRMDIRGIILTIEVIEDIFSPTIMGTITVYDTQDVRTVLPITGMEKLNLKFSTPGTPGINAIEGDGYPFQIHKIEEVRVDEKNPKGQAYIIHFCSVEAYTNGITRVFSAFDKPLETNVNTILRQKYQGLDTKKPLYYEPSRTNTKYVCPSLKPFSAIRQMAKYTQSALYDNAGYLFYETHQGYFLRSFESMMAMGGAIARPEKWHYKYQVANVRPQNQDVRPVRFDMRSVIKYDFTNPVSVLEGINAGQFASLLITHDAFYKKYKYHNYNYKEQFGKHFHTEHDNGKRPKDKMVIPEYKIDGLRGLYETPGSKHMLKSETSKKHNQFESADPASNFNLQHKISQIATIKNRNLDLLVFGNSLLVPGDIIRFDVPMMTPLGHNKKQEMNPYDSGRYLITRVKHLISTSSGRYEQVLNCFKDSVQTPYPKEKDYISTQDKKGKNSNIYEEDKTILSTGGLLEMM